MQGGGDNSVMMSANNSMQGSNVMQGSNAMQGSNSMMMAAQAAPKPADLPAEGDFPDLSGAVTWLNSPPLTPAALKGKVVLTISGPIPASTACAPFLMSAPGGEVQGPGPGG